MIYKKYNKRTKSSKSLTKKEIVQRIRCLFKSYPKEIFTEKQIISQIRIIKQADKFIIYPILKKLCKEKVLNAIEQNKYQWNKFELCTIKKSQNKYQLPDTYPEEAEEEAKKISKQVSESEIKQREDFRKTLTITIDPQNSKDFDDALSYKKISNHKYEIGIHISDVTHYIKPNSIIDKEAFKRGTSIYLTDKVIPMFPERVCNEICSLLPNEDKLCYSVVFEIDHQGEIFKKRIIKTVIHTNRRFTYEEIQTIITKRQITYNQFNIFNEAILTFHHLAKILREKRFDQGAIDFERREILFHLDEIGKPLSVSFIESKEAHQLVEEFMLLANKTIAETIGRPKAKAKTFVYRVHDEPDKEKLKKLAYLAQNLKVPLNLKGENKNISKNIHKLLCQVQGKKEQNLVETLVLQAMAKAIYTTKNIGHYGLAFDCYTHFTSPIRRYPDIIVHRLLEKYLAGQLSVSKPWIEKCCKHCSEQEIIAIQAERASIKAKQVEFMAGKINSVFDGWITGIAKWGIYVELIENGCEGLVPMRYLDDDFYKIDIQKNRLIGKKNKKIYRLGDPLSVKVLHANTEKNQLDFTPMKSK